MSMLLALVAFLVTPVLSEITEINVVRYEALKLHEIENLESLYYTFEFCSCQQWFDARSMPPKSMDCDCQSPIRGKRVPESIPQANYPSACIHSPNEKKCLYTRFQSDEPNRRLFVKVNIGKSVLTFPTWQEIPFARFKMLRRLTSAAGADIQLTYTTAILPDDFEEPKLIQTTTTRPVPTTNKNRNTIKGFKMSWFKKFQRNHLAPEQILNTFRDLEKYYKAPASKTTTTTKITKPTKKLITTTKPPTTTKGYRLGAMTKSQNSMDISDVQRLNTVDDIRRFLHKESANDDISPNSFDVYNFKRLMLSVHNIYREDHLVPALTYDTEIEKAAQRYADNLGNRKSCLSHESPRKYGENLFYFGAQRLPTAETLAKAISRGFYQEGRNYNYNSFNPLKLHQVGHFTQMIWKDSRRMGVGISIRYHDGVPRGPCQPSNSMYLVYVVVKYDPPGNFLSHQLFTNNVVPPFRRRV